MDFIELKAGPDDANRRADKVIKKLIPDQPLSAIYKAMRKGLIKCNSSKLKPEQIINENDVLKIAAFLLENEEQNNKQNDKTTKNHNPESINIPEIILKTQDLLFLNKPYGTLVQKAQKSDFSLDDCVKNYYKQISENKSLSFTPGPLHRLDRNTTGLIAFSWSLNGARWFSQNIQTHVIQKLYLGIVEGNLKKTEIWQDTITKKYDEDKNFQTVDLALKKDSETKTNAYTTATPVKHGKYNGKDITLVQFHIKTGKTHQIRSQSAGHGFPLLGDTAYNAEKQKLSREYFLHAYILKFPQNNPLSLPEQITCPLLPDMEDFISRTCY